MRQKYIFSETNDRQHPENQRLKNQTRNQHQNPTQARPNPNPKQTQPPGTAFASSPNTLKPLFMTDNKQLKGTQDRIRINGLESYEVEYLHQKFPWLSHQTVKDAVDKYGPNRNKVEAHLDRLTRTNN